MPDACGIYPRHNNIASGIPFHSKVQATDKPRGWGAFLCFHRHSEGQIIEIEQLSHLSSPDFVQIDVDSIKQSWRKTDQVIDGITEDNPGLM
jgi:hypothetical protein